jgi:hypothetical protein
MRPLTKWTLWAVVIVGMVLLLRSYVAAPPPEAHSESISLAPGNPAGPAGTAGVAPTKSEDPK